MSQDKRFTITRDFEEHHRQIRDNGKIIMGCFIEAQAKPIVELLNELDEDNNRLRKESENRQALLRDEFKDYFGILRYNAKNLSELAIVDKLQRDMVDILMGVFEE